MADISVLTNRLRLTASIGLSAGVRLSSTDDDIRRLEHEIALINDRLNHLIAFDTHYEFPSCGEENRLYIAQDEDDAVYVWDGDKYVALTGIAALQKQVAVINGGGSLDGE